MAEQSVRDLPKLFVQLGTVVGVFACAVMAWVQSPVWTAWAIAVALAGVSLSPKWTPGHPNRWDMPGAVFQAVGLAAVPSGIALAFMLGSVWAAGAGIVLCILCAVISAELDKPKAAGR